jgi:hypothetical protein
MTLNDQKKAALAHRDADMANYDSQLAFVLEQKKLSLNAHQKAIAVIDQQIEMHLALIGVAA